jgi:glucose/mannose transport system substrate-binding protein
VFLKKNNGQAELADKIAQILVSPNVQADYNIAKGSVSVLKNADQVKMDSCARSSWKVFSRGSATQVPSLAHDMATDGISKDAIIAELMHYFTDDSVQVEDTQRRLIAITRSLPKSR